MIVYPAYMLYSKKETPTNPKLFENGVANYEVKFTDAELTTAGIELGEKGSAEFFNVPLSKFTKLTTSLTGYIKFAITTPTGAVNEIEKRVSPGFFQTYVYEIPAQYRVDGYGIRFVANAFFDCKIESAELS